MDENHVLRLISLLTVEALRPSIRPILRMLVPLPISIWMTWRSSVLLQCLFDRFGSVFPQCGLMVFPGVVIVSR